MSAPRRRKYTYLFLAAVAMLAGASALDPSGLRKHLRLHEEVARYREANARLASQNASLAREVLALRADPSAIERAVREELRYVRPGEIVVRTDGDGGSPP